MGWRGRNGSSARRGNAPLIRNECNRYACCFVNEELGTPLYVRSSQTKSVACNTSYLRDTISVKIKEGRLLQMWTSVARSRKNRTKQKLRSQTSRGSQSGIKMGQGRRKNSSMTGKNTETMSQEWTPNINIACQ